MIKILVYILVFVISFEQIFNEEVEKIEKICKKTSVKALVPSKPFLHPALTSLPVARVPLSTLHIQDTPSTSQGKTLNALLRLDYFCMISMNLFESYIYKQEIQL